MPFVGDITPGGRWLAVIGLDSCGQVTFGRTALCLSGGGAMAFQHFGVVEELLRLGFFKVNLAAEECGFQGFQGFLVFFFISLNCSAYFQGRAVSFRECDFWFILPISKPFRCKASSTMKITSNISSSHQLPNLLDFLYYSPNKLTCPLKNSGSKTILSF